MTPICTQNRFSSPFPKPRLGFSAPPSDAPVQRYVGNLALHRRICPTKRCTGAALGGALKPTRAVGNDEEKRFRVHIGMIGTQNRFYSSFPKPRVGFSAPPSAAPVQRLVGQIRRCNLILPTQHCTGAALSGALKPKLGLGNGEQKRFRMHIGVINTQNRFSLPFPKPRLGFSGPDSAAPTHRRSGIWATKRCTGAALGGVLKPQRGLGNGEKKRFCVHIEVMCTQTRFPRHSPRPA